VNARAGWARVTENVSNTQVAMVCAAISLVVFVVDIASLPLGVAAGIAYVPAVVIALWFPKWQQTFLVAAATSVLTIIGFVLSEPAGVPWMVLTNRLLALVVIWLTAAGGSWLVLSRRSKADKDLQRAQRDAERARSAKMRFLETASNDIRHHLQTLVLLNATLRKTVQNEKAQQLFVMQGDALGHLGDLMSSLLDISEIESGDVELSIEEVELNTVLESIRQEFAAKAQAKNLVLKIHATTEIIRTDRALLTQALRSLVSNAVRYTHEGTVAVHCSRESGDLRITVHDTGIGIERDHLGKIFDEFYRVENDRSGRNIGLGLGLTIVEHIVNMLGVRMDVESEPGRGSSFSLLVPATSG
jgi:signal transduction histidine kinase